jgi:hypothetical protein
VLSRQPMACQARRVRRQAKFTSSTSTRHDGASGSSLRCL